METTTVVVLVTAALVVLSLIVVLPIVLKTWYASPRDRFYYSKTREWYVLDTLPSGPILAETEMGENAQTVPGDSTTPLYKVVDPSLLVYNPPSHAIVIRTPLDFFRAKRK